MAIQASGEGSHGGLAATAWWMRRMTSSSVGYGDFERRPQRQRDLVHAVDRARGADSRRRRRDVDAGQPARVRHLRVEHDRRNAGQVVDGRLRHRRAGIGAQDQRGVDVAANQQVDRRELARVEARIAAAQVDAERDSRSSSA